MDGQLLPAAAIVAGAAAYLAFRAWRALVGRKPGGCGGCSCAPAADRPAGPTMIPVERLRLRRQGPGQPG